MKQIKKKLKKIGVITIIATVLFVSVSFQSRFFEIAKQIEIYTTLFKELNMYYIDKVNPAKLTGVAIKNMLKNLDPYTVYFDEQGVEDAKIRAKGEYAGIGASLKYEKGKAIIQEVHKGFSAYKAGVKVGDELIKVDGLRVSNLNESEFVALLKGGVNTEIEIGLLRQGRQLNFKLKRGKIIISPVPFYQMIDGQTGYISCTRFNEKAAKEVQNAFEDLKEQGMERLILDLRNNPGGLLGQAIRITNFFIPKGEVVVTTQAKVKKWSNTYKTSKKPLDLKIPIVVLINRKSASASEIVAGALQDYDRAIVVGERSFGKGLVQRQRKLTYGTQLKLTISKYYTPSGRCIQELDYANRDAFGKVPKFSESGRNKFKTKNGRIVFDGGGIEPDIKVEINKKTTATKALMASDAIFNFATNFYYQHEDIGKAEDFFFNEEKYFAFKEYLKERDSTFLSPLESNLKNVFSEAKEKEKNAVIKEYAALKNKLKEEKLKEVEVNKDLITKSIASEIVRRYFYKEGVYQQKIKNDITIQKAVELLKDKEKYHQTLKQRVMN